MAHGNVYINNQGNFAKIEGNGIAFVCDLNEATLFKGQNQLFLKYPVLKACRELPGITVERIELFLEEAR